MLGRRTRERVRGRWRRKLHDVPNNAETHKCVPQIE